MTVTDHDREEELLQSVALQNATSILRARQRAERELLEAKEALRQSSEQVTRILDSITDGFLVLDEGWRVTYMNRQTEETLRLIGKTRADLMGHEIWAAIPALVGTEFEQAYRRAAAEKVSVEIESYYPPLSKWFEVRVYPAADGLTIYFQDVTRRKEAEARVASERAVLEAIARGAPLADVLDRIAREVESQSNGSLRCAVFLLGEGGELRAGAAPSLPQEFTDALQGRAGPSAGPPGVAAGEGRAVAAPDLAREPAWADFSALAARHGLRGCAARPVLASQGGVLGSVAAFSPHPLEPGPRDEQILALAADLAGIVVERTRAEEALRRGEERLRATFEQAAVGIAIANREGRFLEMNHKFCDILGYRPDELRALTFRDITYPEDLPATEAAMRDLVAGRIPDYRLEKRYVRRDGTPLWSMATVTMLRDAAAGAGRFIGVIEDISQRKEMEQALREGERQLRESEAQLRTLADSIPQLTWMAEADGHIFWYNRRWFEYTGTTLEQMEGWGWQSVHDPEVLPSVVERWRQSLAEGTPFEMEFPLRGADGVFRWFLTRVSPMRDADGRVVRWFGTNTDVDEVKKIQQALQEETRILELLNRTGTTLALNADLQSILQSITDAATQLSGASFGAFFYNMVDEQGGSYMLYTLSGAPREAFEGFGIPRATPLFGPTFRGEAVIRSDDIREDPRYGRMAPHHGMPAGHLPVRSYLAVPVVSRAGEVIGGLFFGHPRPGVFTERAERLIVGVAAQAAVLIDNARLYTAAQKAAAEREMLLDSERHARTVAEQASRMKDEFLATVSHELRTPLNAILGWSQLLLAKTTSPEDLRKGVETIERNARMQAKLIEDLLEMSRITSGKVRLDVQSVQPVSFVEAALDTLRPAAEAKGLRLEAVLDPAAGPIHGDPGRLQQVVWNLLSNAIKFTPRNGKVQVVLARVDSHVEISVADTGIGIEPAFLGHIFERFRQADASAARQFGGLGLGLAIVKHLVELHGGTVRAQSEGRGMGATFKVHLPLAVVHAGPSLEPRQDPLGAPPVAVDREPVDLSGVTVLVVDDQADARDLVARVLGECRARVVTAADAEEALRLVESERPDVLVSDIGMPVVDGFELLRRVRALGDARGGKVPAIALTAFTRSEDRTRALHHGFRVHVAKPVEPSELIASVASVAGRTGDTGWS